MALASVWDHWLESLMQKRFILTICKELRKPLKRREIMKRILISTVIILVLATALAACGPKQPANHLEAIKKAGTIKVGTSADYPPFEYVDSSGKKIGFDIELMEEIAKQMGVKLEWVDMPLTV